MWFWLIPQRRWVKLILRYASHHYYYVRQYLQPATRQLSQLDLIYRSSYFWNPIKFLSSAIRCVSPKWFVFISPHDSTLYAFQRHTVASAQRHFVVWYRGEALRFVAVIIYHKSKKRVLTTRQRGRFTHWSNCTSAPNNLIWIYQIILLSKKSN